MIIDIHGHLPPKIYIKTLKERNTPPRIESVEGNKLKIIYGEGHQYLIDDRMYSLEKKLGEMNKANVDVQIIGNIMPGLDTLEAETAYDLTKKINDEYADIQEKYDGSFVSVGAVPLQYPEFAIEELQRIKDELNIKGVEIFSNVAGKPLDSPEFLPFFAQAEKLQMPLLIHPTLPLLSEVTAPYGLTGVVGYLFDTTIATLRIIFSGILEKYPKLQIILPHMGSTIPYLISRIDHQFKINPECRKNIINPPSEYFKLIYIDTAQQLYQPAIKCAYHLVGSKKILFGTDYPFADLSKSINSIKELNIPDSEKEEIFSKNAIKLFKI